MADYDSGDEDGKPTFRQRKGKFTTATIPLPKGPKTKKEWYTSLEVVSAVAFGVGALASYLLAGGSSSCPACPEQVKPSCPKAPACPKCKSGSATSKDAPEPNGEIDELNAQINEWKNKYEELLATSKSGSA